MLPTPTYTSWMNLVERWFAERTTKWLRRGSHRSLQELEQSIHQWSRPGTKSAAVRVDKTADEILESLATYCQPISGSGH